MTAVRSRRVVAVVGLGAAGTLVALHLCRLARRRGTPLDLLLIDPAPEAGRGVAYSTRDPRHRLNVPAGNMSCDPDDRGHFVRWLCKHGEEHPSNDLYASRYRYGCYLADTLGCAITAAHGVVAVRRVRSRAVDCRWTERPRGRVAQLVLDDGKVVEADAVVLATGPAPSTTPWLPAALHVDERYIADPWAPGALDPLLDEGAAAGSHDVLLVGTGLTAVDVAVALDRPARTVHAVSRGGLLPMAHAVAPLPPAPCAEPLKGLTLGGMRRAVQRHVARCLRTHGDWRPALDGLRQDTADLWESLPEPERAEFVERYGTLWNTHRHRMPPVTAEAVERMRRTRRLRVSAGRPTAARADAHGLTVGLHDGRELSVGWVVNCTGPGSRIAQSPDPLWRGMAERGDVLPGPLDMGVATVDGRMRDARGEASRALWTLGSPRRGELWETTAIPEIRVQAAAVAGAALDLLG
jgi:uncharacterized NAD(P)/FAD-binding protein YdhS